MLRQKLPLQLLPGGLRPSDTVQRSPLRRGMIMDARRESTITISLFPKAEKPRLSCEKLFEANQKWPVGFQVVLRNSIDALVVFVECRGPENRMGVLEAQIRFERNMVDANVVALEDRSASLEREQASARTVRDLLKQKFRRRFSPDHDFPAPE